MCIQIIGAGNPRYAYIGEVIIAVIKEIVPNMSLERSEVIRSPSLWPPPIILLSKWNS